MEQIAKKDRYLFPHYAFYVREMKIKSIGQLLESYRSLTLTYMADAFGITEDYMDQGKLFYRGLYCVLNPGVNFSPMSPKLVRTYPHIVENQGITMAPLLLRFIL